MELDIIYELFCQEINNDIGSLQTAVAEFDISMYSALEEYELACIIEGTSVLLEDSNNTQMQSVFEGAASNFFGKIAELIKKAANKIAEIVKAVFDKIKKLLNWIKGGIKKAATGGRGTKWPNGFEIDFMKGTLVLSNFSVAGKEFEVFIGNAIFTCAQLVRHNDLQGLEEWHDKHEDIIKLNAQYPQEYFNNKMSVKMGKEENCIKTWIEDIYNYKQFGPDYDVPLSKIQSLIDTAISANGLSKLASVEKNLIAIASGMRDVGDKIEELSKNSPDPKSTKYIQGLSKFVVRYAEFTSIVSTEAIKFASNKYKELAKFLLDNKWCEEKAK